MFILRQKRLRHCRAYSTRVDINSVFGMSIYSGLKGLSNLITSNLQQINKLIYLPIRNSRAAAKIKWVRPPKFKSYTPQKSGDLIPFQMPDKNSILKGFEKNEKLSKCSEEVLKIFSIDNQSLTVVNKQYLTSIVDKVKAHEYDISSPEVMIAKKTAQVRICHSYPRKYQTKSLFKAHLNGLVCHRKRLLKRLRETDYKKFEWLLEKLDLKYVPTPMVKEKVYRRKSVKQLAEFQREKLKELKIAEYKKQLDKLKVPFLENKIQKLKWIMEQEAMLQITPTVAQSDIDECLKKIEEVKLEIEEREKRGYIRKIHPYTLEAYDPFRFNT